MLWWSSGRGRLGGLAGATSACFELLRWEEETGLLITDVPEKSKLISGLSSQLLLLLQFELGAAAVILLLRASNCNKILKN